MSEQERSEEIRRRVSDLQRIIDERIKLYPHTWQQHSDLPPIMREYYNLTRDNAYELIKEQKRKHE